MYKSLVCIGLLLSLLGCDQTTSRQEGAIDIHVLPQPKEANFLPQKVLLSDASGLYAADPDLQPLLELFASEIEALTGLPVPISAEADASADIVFSLNPGMDAGVYQLDIQDQIEVSGGSYQALVMAKTTLLQLMEKEGDRLAFPVGNISDHADAAYRGLMIDLARKWHSLESIKQLIDLAAFYKINYVQLHFTDYQSYTLPSRIYPNLSSPGRHYTFEELHELESYSQLRGVTIIPEIDVPGHSSPFVRQYPEIFAIEDTASNPWIINMGKEAVYAALDTLIGEMTTIFQASPYFHIGGDEAIFTRVEDDPSVQAYAREKGIGEDVHELYRHFLVRMNQIVKARGKQMCVWEGFGPTGEIEIPRDIIVFEFETNRYLPDQLVADGYTVVNTSWKPLYVVNQKKWSPESIYSWNLWRWENWWSKAPSFTPIQIEKSPLLIGAQMCAWEQAEELEIPSLRKRLPAMAERIWNTSGPLPYEEFLQRMELLDDRLSPIIRDSRQDSLLIGYEFEG